MTIDAMLDGYVECALWASLAWWQVGPTENPPPVDETYSADDLASETLDEMRQTCEAFATENAADLDGMIPAQVGHTLFRPDQLAKVRAVGTCETCGALLHPAHGPAACERINRLRGA